MDISNTFPRYRPWGKKARAAYQPKKGLVARQVASASNTPHYFKRTYNYGTVTTGTVTETLGAFNFSLNDLPGYTELTALFDFYKINAVKVRFIPYQTESNSTGTVNNAANVPIIFVVDRSDGTPPATVNELLEYNDHKIARLYDGFTCYFKPKFSDATSAIRDGWVATSNPSLNYWSLKYGVPPTVNAMNFYVIHTYYVSCKDPK